jgi:hypothetical protein
MKELSIIHFPFFIRQRRLATMLCPARAFPFSIINYPFAAESGVICYTSPMTLQQTLTIPATRRRTIEVPKTQVFGTANVVLTGTRIADKKSREAALSPDVSASPEASDVIEQLRGLGKRLGSTLSVDRFLEMRREDVALEEAQYRRMFHHEEEA